MSYIVVTFCNGQFVNIKTVSCDCQSWGFWLIRYFSRLKEGYPFVKVVDCQLVEIVYTKQVILGKDVASLTLRSLSLLDVISEEHLALTVGEAQYVVRLMQSAEYGLAMIDIIFSLAE